MKKALWELLAVLTLLVCCAVVVIYTLRSRAGSIGTPESLAEQFISNVNTKNRDEQWELIHPTCIQKMSSLQKEFINATLARDFQNVIPEERTIKILTWAENRSLPFGSIGDWPVTPTHRFEVEFSTTEHPILGIARYILKEENAWFIVVPLIHDDRLRQHAEMKMEMDVMGATWYEAPGSGPESSTREVGR